MIIGNKVEEINPKKPYRIVENSYKIHRFMPGKNILSLIAVNSAMAQIWQGTFASWGVQNSPDNQVTECP